MTFDPKILARVARCFCFLPKTEVRAIIVYLLCQWAKSGEEIVYHPQVVDWVSRVIGAGGSDPSESTKDALSDFMYSLDAASLTPKIIALNCFVPDSLIACCVPLIANAGLTVWTNNNFVDSDLSVNGLQGSLNAPNKYLETGLTANDWPIDPNFGIPDAGVSICHTSNYGGVGDNCCWKFVDGTGIEWSLLMYGTNSSEAILGDPVANKLSSMGTGSDNMFFGVNSFTDYSIPALAFRCYSGRTPFGIVLEGEQLNVGVPPFPGTGPVGVTLPLFITNNNGVYQNPSKIRLSFAAYHEGLPQTDTDQLYALIQTMRTALGGGFV